MDFGDSYRNAFHTLSYHFRVYQALSVFRIKILLSIILVIIDLSLYLSDLPDIIMLIAYICLMNLSIGPIRIIIYICSGMIRISAVYL